MEEFENLTIASSSPEDQEFQMKYLCDETTFRMFDLERGGFLNYRGDSVQIDDLWRFLYKRIPVSESINESTGLKTIVSNFFITVKYNNAMIFDFEVYGAEKRFRVNVVDGFRAAMFLNELDKFRATKFGLEP